MPSFSATSLRRLSTCHYDLQYLFNEVIKEFDCVVIEGNRNKEDQEKYFKSGATKLHYPYGNHNAMPSNAVDVAPYNKKTKGIEWKDNKSFYFFSGYVICMAKMLYKQERITHHIRWGGDWDSDNDLNDQTFNDLVHFEIVN